MAQGEQARGQNFWMSWNRNSGSYRLALHDRCREQDHPYPGRHFSFDEYWRPPCQIALWLWGKCEFESEKQEREVINTYGLEVEVGVVVGWGRGIAPEGD